MSQKSGKNSKRPSQKKLFSKIGLFFFGEKNGQRGDRTGNLQKDRTVTLHDAATGTMHLTQQAFDRLKSLLRRST
jgi:hypothetical protein